MEPESCRTVAEAVRVGDVARARGDIATALADLLIGLKKVRIAHVLAALEIKERYKRSRLGPFWLTISLAVWLGTVSFVFTKIFNLPVSSYLPQVSCGLLIWNFLSQTLNDSCLCFINHQEYIKSAPPLPFSTIIYRSILYNLYIFAHNAIIILLLVWFLQGKVNPLSIMAAPAMVIVAINAAWMATILAIICARYRDLPQVVANVLQVGFYLTPVVWLPSLLKAGDAWFLMPNLFYHLIEIVRVPIVSGEFQASHWLVSLAAAALGWIAAILVLARYRRHISYWI